jgi:putative nucleotidyltransferase with HDIG domain
MYLGFQTVRNMVLSSTIDQVLKGYDLSMYNYERGGLGKHSFATAVASQVISKQLRPGLRDTAFTAGLLHDVGKIILGKYIQDHKNDLLALSESEIVTREAEKGFFGADHAEVGARIADNWNFPQELTLAIGFHHKPEDAKGRPLLAVIVCLADNICLRLGDGLLSACVERPLGEYVVESTGTSEEEIGPLGEQVRESIDAMSTPNPDAK